MRLLGTAALASAVLCLVIAGCRTVPETPEEALRQFYTAEQVAEDQLMDPLILRGKDVVPLVVRDIERRSMKRRLYAILALGNIGDPRAVPALREILLDPTEDLVTRKATIYSIAMIDTDAALAVFPQLEPAAQAEFADARADIARGEIPYRRTYAQARRGEHWP